MGQFRAGDDMREQVNAARRFPGYRTMGASTAVEQLATEEALLVQALEARAAMASFLFEAAGFVLAMVALGLLRILRGPAEADRMMAAQLVGTGGVAVPLLLAAATATPSVVDVALMLALLAAFASVAAVSAGAFFFMGTVGLLRFPTR
jgi:multicomponent Na+:H+ antiporter subunit F